MNGRDPKTGRFLPGNQIAVGNRGNINSRSKWGNKNAQKHGFYTDFTLSSPLYFESRNGDGLILIYRGMWFKIARGNYIKHEDYSLSISVEILEELERRGCYFPNLSEPFYAEFSV